MHIQGLFQLLITVPLTWIKCTTHSPTSTHTHTHTHMQTNRFIDRHKPWRLVQDTADHTWLQTVLAVAVETVRLSGTLLYPVMPSSSREILSRIGLGLRVGTRGEEDGRRTAGGSARSIGGEEHLQCSLRSEESVQMLAQTARLQLGGEPLFSKVTKS